MSIFVPAVRPWGEARSSGADENREPQVDMVVMFVDLLRRALWRLGPYALVEIVLPGGTLIALLLYLRRRAAHRSAIRQPPVATLGARA